jgi:transcriptional regulator with XRE-family HTH domain
MKNSLQKNQKNAFEKERALFWSGVENARIRIRVGQEISDSRKTLKITQADLAKQCGTTQRLISNIENGDINVGIELLNRISKALAFEAANWSRIFGHRLPVPVVGWIIGAPAIQPSIPSSGGTVSKEVALNENRTSYSL